MHQLMSSKSQNFPLSVLQMGDGEQSIFISHNSLFIRRTLQHRGHSKKVANWTIHLILFVSTLKHAVLR